MTDTDSNPLCVSGPEKDHRAYEITWSKPARLALSHCNKIGFDLLDVFSGQCADPNKPMGEWQSAWMQVIERATEIIAENWGGNEPSPFKKVAALALSIVELAPIPEMIPVDLDAKENETHRVLMQTPRVLAASIGFELALELLTGASIGRNSHQRILEKPISPSKHFYGDILAALALSAGEQRPDGDEPQRLSRVSHSFNFASLTFEALAYAANGWPEAEKV